MNLPLTCFFILTLSFNAPLRADPASDGAVITKLVQQIKLLRQHSNLMQRALEASNGQIDHLKQLKQFNSGHFGFGSLHNSLADVQQRQSANNWRQTLKGVAGGNPERYQELVHAYEKQHADLNAQQFSKGASMARTQRFSEQKETIQAASVESETAFNDINASLKRLHDLSVQIEKADHTKAAIDLNSRLLTEIGYLQAQNLKAQAILNQQIATHSGASLSEEAELARYLSRN